MKSHGGLTSILAVAVASFAVTGCTSWGNNLALDSTSGLYEQATIAYRVDAGKEGLALSAARIEGQLVSYDQVPSSPQADRSVGTLTLVYPHPRGMAGAALARVEIKSRWSSAAEQEAQASAEGGLSSRVTKAVATGRWSDGGDSLALEETWELSVTKAELDQIVARMNQQGFFDSKKNADSGIQLTAKIDGGQISKDWEQVPELDWLMRRVRSEGQLVAYTRTPGTRLANRNAFSSVTAYREIEQQKAAVAAQTVPATHQSTAPYQVVASQTQQAAATSPYPVTPYAPYPTTLPAPQPRLAQQHGLSQPPPAPWQGQTQQHGATQTRVY